VRRVLCDVGLNKRKRSAGSLVIAQTVRLELREFEKADWREVHEYASDPQVVRFTSWGPNTEEETRRFIQRSNAYQKEKPRVKYSLAVVIRDGNRLIGGCGIYESNIESREGWIGYCLNRQFWGQGYATETARALLGFGFTHLNLHRIFATCDPANTASAHVMEKIGMQYEGHLRENMQCRGTWRDSLLYAILDHEWKTSK
jgi:RimJ/RimL family protein N-acetyltransferase